MCSREEYHSDDATERSGQGGLMKRSLYILVFLCSLALSQTAATWGAAEVVNGDLGQKIDRYLQKAEANGYAGSVLVARGEKIILAKGYGLADRENKVKKTAETVFSIGSLPQKF